MRFGIISAGKGKRLVSEGYGQPKPLVPVNGVPMIERLARIMMRCGAERIAVIVNADNRETVEFVTRLSSELPIDLTVKSTPSPMHSLMELAPYLGNDRFCVTTVDTVFSENLFHTMMDEFARIPYDGMMGVTSLIDDEKPLYVDILKECLDSGQVRMRYFQRQLLQAGMQLKAFDMEQVVDVDHAGDVVKAQQIASEL